jgi:hypothetical protein
MPVSLRKTCCSDAVKFGTDKLKRYVTGCLKTSNEYGDPYRDVVDLVASAGPREWGSIARE